MSSTRIRAIATAMTVTPILVLSGVGVAHAYHDPYPGDSKATCQSVGGRERIKVTVNGRPGGYYIMGTNPAGAHFHLGNITVGASGSGSAVFTGHSAGSYGVEAFENALGSGGRAPGCIGSVTVSAANPLLDAVDSALAGAGSSALVTDPTRR
ncbi:hypothetical protein [Nocardia sp. XZ_19_385]|uniref:hypothetical protein n=1 Tax=Nocardia sp. XZ_19_385 TaxID=2769488 RepID=UPI00188E256A|nr:hypothetical protein [Nocardia sp. XZ_19_385]